jgi:hypothetical protein
MIWHKLILVCSVLASALLIVCACNYPASQGSPHEVSTPSEASHPREATSLEEATSPEEASHPRPVYHPRQAYYPREVPHYYIRRREISNYCPELTEAFEDYPVCYMVGMQKATADYNSLALIVEDLHRADRRPPDLRNSIVVQFYYVIREAPPWNPSGGKMGSSTGLYVENTAYGEMAMANAFVDNWQQSGGVKVKKPPHVYYGEHVYVFRGDVHFPYDYDGP